MRLEMEVSAVVAAEDAEAAKALTRDTAATTDANLHAVRPGGHFAVFVLFLSTVFSLSSGQKTMHWHTYESMGLFSHIVRDSSIVFFAAGVRQAWANPFVSSERQFGRGALGTLRGSRQGAEGGGPGLSRPQPRPHHSPFSILHFQFASPAPIILHSPFSIFHLEAPHRHFPFSILHSPFGSAAPSFSILHFPFSIWKPRPPSFSILHSPFSIFHLEAPPPCASLTPYPPRRNLLDMSGAKP